MTQIRQRLEERSLVKSSLFSCGKLHANVVCFDAPLYSKVVTDLRQLSTIVLAFQQPSTHVKYAFTHRFDIVILLRNYDSNVSHAPRPVIITQVSRHQKDYATLYVCYHLVAFLARSVASYEVIESRPSTKVTTTVSRSCPCLPGTGAFAVCRSAANHRPTNASRESLAAQRTSQLHRLLLPLVEAAATAVVVIVVAAAAYCRDAAMDAAV